MRKKEKGYLTPFYINMSFLVLRRFPRAKNPSKPRNIDLILPSCTKHFFKTDTIFAGLSGFCKLVLSLFKTTFTKFKPKETVYRNYRKFNENIFN